jgi:hypothetical protein
MRKLAALVLTTPGDAPRHRINGPANSEPTVESNTTLANAADSAPILPWRYT